MSIVTVQLGQCGNQVGSELFSTVIEDCESNVKISKSLSNSYCSVAVDRFFHSSDYERHLKDGSLRARAVMIDMESKVVSQACADASKTGKWRYSSKHQVTQKKGSGNNWAHGFCKHGPENEEDIMNVIRKEVEKTDNLGGFLCLSSLAGGTGSGVGAYVNQCLRNEYPMTFLLNQVVWPFDSGEVILQSLNSILSLSHIVQSSDGVIVCSNSALQKICTQLMGITKVSLRDLNSVIAHKLASVFLPATRGLPNEQNTLPLNNYIGNLISECAASPAYKLLNIKSLPHISSNNIRYSMHRWPGLVRHLNQMLIADASMEEGIDWGVKAANRTDHFNHSVGNVCIARGIEVEKLDTDLLGRAQLYPKWLQSQDAFSLWTNCRPFKGLEKSMVLLSNSQSITNPLDHLIDQAWNMFSSGAYVHQYERYGLDKEDFMQSFAILETVLADYRAL